MSKKKRFKTIKLNTKDYEDIEKIIDKAKKVGAGVATIISLIITAKGINNNLPRGKA